MQGYVHVLKCTHLVLHVYFCVCVYTQTHISSCSWVKVLSPRSSAYLSSIFCRRHSQQLSEQMSWHFFA
jgi:hypothetical protein